MKLTCLQENLSRAVSIVGRAVSTRNVTLPITQNVLITTEDSMLKISGTDLNMAMTTWVAAQIEEEGAVTVPARLVGDFVNSLPPEVITMESTKQPLGVNIKCESFESNVSGMDANDFPPIPAVQEGVAAKIEPCVLREAIRRVAFAAANDNTRPVLTGVKVEIKGDEAKFVAADGFRLAVYNVKLATAPSEDMEFLVPARVLTQVARLLTGQEEPVEFMVTKATNQVMFHVGNVEVVSALIAGAFPNYSALIPQSHKTRAVLGSEGFQQATKTAAIFARDGSDIVRLQTGVGEANNGGHLKVAARAVEVGDNESQIAALVKGEDSHIAFNSKYLLDVLDVLSGDVAMEISAPTMPGVLKGAADDSYLHVVMPMFVEW